MINKARLKSIVFAILKLAFALGLVVWMVSSGKLDLGQLKILVDRPEILGLSVLVWILAPTLLGSLRWYYLLVGAGYQVSWPRVINLHLIGLFFNSAMPGAVGGDLIKVLYVIRDNRSLGKAPAMMSIILDRVIGLFGLFSIGFIFILADLEAVMSSRLLAPIGLFIGLFMVLMVIMYTLAIIQYKGGRDPIARLLEAKVPGFSIALKIYIAFRQYSDKPRYLFSTWALSVATQILFFSYFAVLSKVMLSSEVSVSSLALIFPIGVLTTALPLAPGGLGVGHVAFDKLFALIGQSGGANVFNVYVLSQLALNLLGIIPYLFLKKTEAITPDPSQWELQSSSN